MKAEDLCITGCGIATAIGCDSHEFMTNLEEGKSKFRSHPLIQAENKWNSVVAYVDEEDLNRGINSRIARKLDRFTLLSLKAFQEAQKHAALTNEIIYPFGLLLGNCTGGWTFVEPQMEDIYRGNYENLSPYVATAWFPTAPQGEISIQSKISGYSKTFAADALSSGYALEHACYLIQHGYLPGVFVGGVEAPLSPLVYNSCIRHESISSSGNYLPFHKDADGCLLGEGAGLLTVEAFSNIQQRNGRPLARIASIGIGSNLSEAIERCLDEAMKKAEDIDCIFLDAKGTPSEDYEEYCMISKYFGCCRELYLTATKTLYGNLLAADLAVQLAIAVLSLWQKKIPRGLFSKNNHIMPPTGHLVLDRPIEKKLKYILVYARNRNGNTLGVLVEAV
jgi:3-oxoacyl-(acyl-carrier-protein) synthase